MKNNSFSKKRVIHVCVIIVIVILLVLTVGFIMLKYSVEGEKKLPFNLKSLNIISTAESDIKQDEEENWHANILQKNDILFIIEKNENYKRQDTIKRITIDNFQITKGNENVEINIYRPQSNEFKYIYSDEYKITDSLVYEGNLETKINDLQVNNQGCKFGFSVTVGNLGEYNFSTNEKVPIDGKLLAKAGLKEEDVKFLISFDLTIETGNSNKFKTNISLELPTGNIFVDGVSTNEDNKLEDIIFKRIK